MATIIIRIDADLANDALAGFPFTQGQYIASESESDGFIVVLVESENDFADTTSAQEQFLNASPAVIGYQVAV